MANDSKTKPTVARKSPPLSTPQDLLAALEAAPAAKAKFDALPPSHRREYVRWIEEAKREPTRRRRIAQSIEKLTS